MLKLRSTLAFACLLLLSVSAMPLQAINIIPQPSEVKTLPGTFSLSGATAIIPGKCAGEASQLQQALQETYGLSLPLKPTAKNNYIRFSLNEKLGKELGNEGYLLQVSPENITITAASTAGVFYGIQSLRQLITANGNEYTIGAVSIKDKPRFGWRAFMLDEGRYFKGGETVKHLLDEMALLKMNVFHWHLTDDQGWRIEIKKISPAYYRRQQTRLHPNRYLEQQSI